MSKADDESGTTDPVSVCKTGEMYLNSWRVRRVTKTKYYTNTASVSLSSQDLAFSACSITLYLFTEISYSIYVEEERQSEIGCLTDNTNLCVFPLQKYVLKKGNYVEQ